MNYIVYNTAHQNLGSFRPLLVCCGLSAAAALSWPSSLTQAQAHDGPSLLILFRFQWNWGVIEDKMVIARHSQNSPSSASGGQRREKQQATKTKGPQNHKYGSMDFNAAWYDNFKCTNKPNASGNI